MVMKIILRNSFFTTSCKNTIHLCFSLACAMITRKLEEKRLTNATHLIRIDDEYQIKTKYFNIGFFKTNHSIPESLGIIINSPNGRIVSTGDFKFDLTPVGDPADFQKCRF